MSCFWKAEEIDFSNDYDDFITLNDDEQYFIEMILAFFAASDGIVNFNLGERFSREVKITEAQFAYSFQMMMENVHCVSADTLILTDTGYEKIGELVNKEVKVWNGKQFSSTEVKYTGDSSLYRVKLSNGMELDCTPNHKWFVKVGNQLHLKRCTREKIFTKDLIVGNIVHEYDLPILKTSDPNNFKNPYMHGFFCGDGTYCNNYPFIALYGEKKQLMYKFNPDSYSEDKENDKIQFYITSKINKQKYDVPINYSKETKLRWLEGFCDADGSVNLNSNKTATAMQLYNTEYGFLKDIQLLLTTLGINSNMQLNHEERKDLLPDGKGGHKYYDCKKCYILYITCESVERLVNIGFNPIRLKLKVDKSLVYKPKCIKIESITELKGMHKTYCFTEPEEHAGIFNGILTGQSEVYSLMLDNIVKDPIRRNHLFNAIETEPCVKQLADWAFKWINSSESFAHRLVAFAIVEGLFFSGMFAAIFWIKKYKNDGKTFMGGLINSNKFIARDEGQHTALACELYKELKHKLPAASVNEIVSEAVIISKNFMTHAMPVKLIGMNSDHMNQYIEYIADRLLGMLGYNKVYDKKNPFDFMKTIGLNDKTNFFESRPTEYQDAHINNVGKKISQISLDKIDDLDF